MPNTPFIRPIADHPMQLGKRDGKINLIDLCIHVTYSCIDHLRPRCTTSVSASGVFIVDTGYETLCWFFYGREWPRSEVAGATKYPQLFVDLPCRMMRGDTSVRSGGFHMHGSWEVKRRKDWTKPTPEGLRCTLGHFDFEIARYVCL